MKGTSSKKHGLGFQQRVLLEYFADHPTAVLTSRDVVHLGLITPGKITAKNPAAVQNFASERLASLVRRGMLARKAIKVNHHMEYTYELAMSVPRLCSILDKREKAPAPARTAKAPEHVRELKLDDVQPTSDNSGPQIILSCGAILGPADVKELLDFLIVRG